MSYFSGTGRCKLRPTWTLAILMAALAQEVSRRRGLPCGGLRRGIGVPTGPDLEQKIGDAQNLDAPELPEREKMLVPGDDDVRAGNGAL
jgi:hypothetical protein